MLVPLNPRVAARVARRRERALATAYYESKAEAEHRESMRDMESADRKRAEQDEAEARRREEERRAERNRDEGRKRQREREHARNVAARAELARAQKRNATAVILMGGLVAAALWGGREHIARVLGRLGVGVDPGAGPTPENVGAVQAAIAQIVMGDDNQAIDQAWAAEEADCRDALTETVQKMTEMAATKGSVP